MPPPRPPQGRKTLPRPRRAWPKPPRPRKGPPDKKEKPKAPPSPAAKLYEAKPGLANGYFNRQQRDRLFATFRKLAGEATAYTGTWTLTGQVKLAELEEVRERCRRTLVTRSKDKKLLEKLKSNKAERHAQQEKLAEQNENDDMASIRYQPPVY